MTDLDAEVKRRLIDPRHNKNLRTPAVDGLVEALEGLITAEWMVTHDWGGDREAVLEKAKQALANFKKEGE